MFRMPPRCENTKCGRFTAVFSRLFTTAVALVVGLASALPALAAPVYWETFQFCPRVTNDRFLAQQLVGWAAMRKGQAPNDAGNLKSSAPGGLLFGLPFRSAPVGALSGNVLWTRPITGLTIFTQEFSFDIGSVTRIEYEQRLDGFSTQIQRRDGSRLALLIGGTWYLSDTLHRVSKRSVWERVSIDLASAKFGTIAGSANTGPANPSNSGVSLPSSGTVTAFGVYVPRASNRVRIDNFGVFDSRPDSEAGPAAIADLAPCSASVSVVTTQTPTPTATGTGNPIETGAPSSTPDQGVVPGMTVTASATPTIPASLTATSTPSPTPTVGAQVTSSPGADAKKPLFCSETQLQALGSLKVPKKFSRLVVTSLPGTSLKGLRDRVIMAIILQGNPRLDLLVNAVVEDYDPTTGILKLPLVPRADGDFSASTSATLDIKLDAFAQRQATRYLRRYLRDGNRAKYLFPRVNRASEVLIETALCSPQLRRLVRLRAERAGFKIRFNNP